MVEVHVKPGGMARTIYTQITHSDSHESDSSSGYDRVLEAEHVEIGAAVIVFCRLRSSRRRVPAGEPHCTRYTILHWYLQHAQPAGPDVGSILRLLRPLGLRSRPGIIQIPQSPMGKRVYIRDLHEVNAQVAGIFVEDQQRDSGVRHPNRHLDGALCHVLGAFDWK